MKPYLMINVLHRAVRILLALLALIALTVHAQGKPLLVEHSSDMDAPGIGHAGAVCIVVNYSSYEYLTITTKR